MSHPAMITEAQHAHFKAFITGYVADHELTLSDIGRRVPGMAAGSVAGAVRQRPAYRFIQRLMAAYGWTEEELLGPPAPPVDIPGDPPTTTQTQEELVFTCWHGQECLRALKGSHGLFELMYRELQDIHALLDALHVEFLTRPH